MTDRLMDTNNSLCISENQKDIFIIDDKCLRLLLIQFKCHPMYTCIGTSHSMLLICVIFMDEFKEERTGVGGWLSG